MNTTAITLAPDIDVRALSASEFAFEVDRGGSVVVDVREAEERIRDGSIRGSIHVPRGIIEFRADPTDATFDRRLQHSARILVFCSDGRRAALAADTLASMGYSNVVRLDGGLCAWAAASLPLYGAQITAY